MAKFSTEGLSKAMAHFSLFRVVEAWAKRYFSMLVLGWEDSGALEAELLCTKRRKAFYIISNYRQRWTLCGAKLQRSGEQRFAAALRIILIM
ncbi:hypothetical protein AR685_17725 [Chryseobacterium sp. JAH]|nr:hypothetical protein AR685_17725 [Chryseobacterium sp. JAH]